MNTSSNVIPLILSGIALIIGAYCLWQTLSLNRLRKSFFAGNNALDLESVIRAVQTATQSNQEHQLILEEALQNLRNDFSFSIQKLGVVRFNPFDDGGGNFSFTIALLDGHNTGVVLTSMHGRQQNRIYTKKIINGKSESQLTEEETQAVIDADDKYQNSKSKQTTN